MIFYDIFHPSDRDFVDENNQIRPKLWKSYWDFRTQDPETRRQARIEKAATRKRIHKKARRIAKDKLRKVKNEYKIF